MKKGIRGIRLFAGAAALLLAGCALPMAKNDMPARVTMAQFPAAEAAASSPTEEPVVALTEEPEPTLEEESESALSEERGHLSTAVFRYKPFEREKVWDLLARYAGDTDREGSLSQIDADTALSYLRNPEPEHQNRYYNLLLFIAVSSQMRQTGAFFESSNDFGRRSQLAALNPGGEISVKAQKARDNAISFLEELGYEIGYLDFAEVSPGKLLEMGALEKEMFGSSAWLKLLPEEEEGICLAMARQKAGGVLVERYCSEACIKLVLSVKDGTILEAESFLPPFLSDPVGEEETALITKEEAISCAAAKLEERGMAGVLQESAGAVLVYALDNLVNPFHSDEQTVTLIPAWKVTFPVRVGEEVIEEYVLIDGRTGRQLNNETPL